MPRLADIITATGGDLTARGIVNAGLTLRQYRRAVVHLDKAGLTARQAPTGARVLAVPLRVAVAALGDAAIPERQPRADAGKSRRIRANDEMRLVYDPSGLFSVARRATFPSSQVLPDPDDEPGAWATGTRFERWIDGALEGLYEYDGEQVVEVAE